MARSGKLLLLLALGLATTGTEISAEEKGGETPGAAVATVSVLFREPQAPVDAAAEGEPDLEAGELRFRQVCALCHGAKGEGNAVLRSPSIAGMADWYVATQIGKFQKDWRGTEPTDAQGLQMYAIARTLDREAVRDVAGYIKLLKMVPTKVTLKGGDPKRGAELYRERCMECHRYNGRGEAAFRSGRLIGLQDWYIVAQMEKFRAGTRGAAEGDMDGAKMHRVAERMRDEGFLDIATHIAELAEKYAEVKPRRRQR